MQTYTAKKLIDAITKAPSAHSQHLLALFDTLDLIAKDSSTQVDPLVLFTDAFTHFYLKQARKTNVENPDSLAAHLLLIAQKAFIEQQAGHEAHSLHHAKTVAKALIQSQTKSTTALSASFLAQNWFAMTASCFVFATIAWISWHSYQIKQQPLIASQTKPFEEIVNITVSNKVTADQASEMYKKFEMMRNGTCRYLEAIQIPDKHKAVYIENVMGGTLPKNLKDLAIANAYLEKIQCSYTPMLMKKST